MASQSSTTAQLRADIDQGRTGSKVDHPDPAAAPLGTDEEAAGTPPEAAAIAAARREEASLVRSPGNRQGLGSAAAIYAGLLALIIAALSGIAVWLAS
jgi:hypothetical protein